MQEDQNIHAHQGNGVEQKSYYSEQQEKKQLENKETPLQLFEATAPRNSLTEGVGRTLLHELKGICIKFSFVLIPRQSNKQSKWLRDWDLWGPFILCLIFVFFVNNSNVFMVLLFSVFIGSICVAFNTRILGGYISLLQCVAVLGYCILPLLIAVIILGILKFFQINNRLIRMAVVFLTVIWATFAARSFLTVNISKGKRFVALFPIIVFYTFIGVLLSFS